MTPDKNRFETARLNAFASNGQFNIGTYKERSLHSILKHYYEPDISRHEVPLLGHVADIFDGETVTEIQTGSFSPLRGRLASFLSRYSVKIVFPCLSKRRICWTDPESGDTTYSPYRTYKNEIFKLLPQLLYISEFFATEKLSVDIVICTATKIKLLDGYGKDRKKRATATDTVPDEVCDVITISSKEDLCKILPFADRDKLTLKELEAFLGLKRRKLWMAVKLLTEWDILELSEKVKNKYIYTVKKQ